MRYAILLIVGWNILGCASKNFEIPQTNVVATLTNYANQYAADEWVTLETSEGVIQLRLYQETPLHRANFLHMIKNQFYTHGQFYRIVENLVIQGGNNPDVPRPRYEIPQELRPHLFHKRGALSMASDKPAQFSSASEFFIVSGRKYTDLALEEFQQELNIKYSDAQRTAYKTVGGDPRLDGKYTVFGEVVKGMEVVEKIANKKLYQTDKPVEKITFKIYCE